MRPAEMKSCGLNVVVFEVEHILVVEERDDAIRLGDGTEGHDIEGFSEGIVAHGSEGSLGGY